jgi:hypothetical protein
MALMSLLISTTLLTTSAATITGWEEEYHYSLEELPGGAVSPGGAIDFRFEYSSDGERLLFKGWTGPNDIRVMDEDLTHIKTIDLPTENFQVNDAHWGDRGSIIVWGNNGSGLGDDLLVYKVPDLELDASFLPREAIPLVTIDSAMLLAGELIMMVAGRADNGTSMIISLEIQTDSILTNHTVYGNLTIEATAVMSHQFVALDVEGGATLIDTTRWTYDDRIVDIDGPFSFARLRTNHPWTVGGEDGHVLMKKDFLLNQTFDMTYEVPAQAACWLKANLTNSVIIALPKAGGGSKIQGYHDRNGSFELGDELETEGTVTTMVSVVSVRSDFYKHTVISVGFASGEFKQYNIADELKQIPIYASDEDEDGKWQDSPLAYVPGTIIIIAVVLVIRYYLRKGTKD